MANRVHRVVAVLIQRDGKYLLTQRRDEAILPRLWEFPGGRVEEGEPEDEALRREFSERVGASVIVDAKVAERHHVYKGYEVHLTLYSGHLQAGTEPTALRVRDVRWVASEDLSQYEFPPADQATMDKLLGLTRRA